MIEIFPFGEHNGQSVQLAILENEHLRVEMISFGAITKSIKFAGQEMILGYDDLAGYIGDQNYIGAIAGRCANRIANGRFSLEGRDYQLAQNNNGHHLHGGPEGFARRVWSMSQDGDILSVKLHSPDGDENYSAALDVELRIWLEENRLVYDFKAQADGPTLVNLAQHNYYQLGGDMLLKLDAERYTPVDEELIPTGELKLVDEKFDYSKFKTPMADLDHNFELKGKAELLGDNARMEIRSDQMGIQAYSGGSLSAPFRANQAICLEPQYFPNAINVSGFEAPIFGPEKSYSQTTSMAFFLP